MTHCVMCKSGPPVRKHSFTPLCEQGAVTISPRLITSDDTRNSAQPNTSGRERTAPPSVSWRLKEG